MFGLDIVTFANSRHAQTTMSHRFICAIVSPVRNVGYCHCAWMSIVPHKSTTTPGYYLCVCIIVTLTRLRSDIDVLIVEAARLAAIRVVM